MYSQNNEDEIIIKYFNGFKGCLLDVGANDGSTFSNSLAMIKEGWDAYLFEPSSVCGDLFLLHKDNPNVHIYHAGLGNSERNEILQESGAHVKGGKDKALVSTCLADEMTRWVGVDFIPVDIRILSFKEWWKQNSMPFIHFISIDCEGMDWEVLQEIDLASVNCQCLCIEWNSNAELGKQYTDYCAQYGMKLLHKNAENMIFVK